MTIGTVERSERPRAARRGEVRVASHEVAIVSHSPAPVKHEDPAANGKPTPARRRKKTRRQSHGSAWHWIQTDSWYYTLPGTKNRVPLFNEDGNRIRGVENRKAAQLAMARVKLGQGWQPELPPASPDEWVVAKVCSEYLQYCERGVANGSVSKGHRDGTDWFAWGARRGRTSADGCPPSRRHRLTFIPETSCNLIRSLEQIGQSPWMAREQRPDLLNLVLPRFHEPNDHAKIGNASLGNRRWQAREEIPVAAQVRAHAGGQRDAGRVATFKWAVGDR
jgi:hypothetical protein